MNERNVAASVRARLLNRARETKQDFSLMKALFRQQAKVIPRRSSYFDASFSS